MSQGRAPLGADIAPPGIIDGLPEKAAKQVLLVRAMWRIDVNLSTGCWEWFGAKQSNGYGRMWDGGKSAYAHRVLYTIFYGEIAKGQDIDHLCRNRGCVNPFHLEAVSMSENLKRGNAGENIATISRSKTHCPRGHEYSKENTRLYRGRRHCRACARERYHRNKGV